MYIKTNHMRACCVRTNQCCQLAEIAAEKHKSGPIKISAAGRNSGQIFSRFFKKWQKSGRTLLLCVLHIIALIIGRNRLVKPWVNSTIFPVLI
jgi:hypothetical protein